MSRVLLRLRKGEQVKYISHLDLMRAFEFALRRARVPVAYSEGFNPRPKMSFGSAVGVGTTSDDERILLSLAKDEPAEAIMERLNENLPEGIEVLSAEEVPNDARSPLAGLNASEFRLSFECGDECSAEALEQAAKRMLEFESIPILRERAGKQKRLDLRPLLTDVRVVCRSNGCVLIEIVLKSEEGVGARPQDFVQALQEELPGIEIRAVHRICQLSLASASDR